MRLPRWIRWLRRVWRDSIRSIRAWVASRLRKKTLGERGEDIAATFLRRNGHTILATRARHRLGEIDLVSTHDRVVVFVEVKTRQSGTDKEAFQAISPEQRRRIIRSGFAYLKRHDLMAYRARFDAIAVVFRSGNSAPAITHEKNIFVIEDGRSH